MYVCIRFSAVLHLYEANGRNRCIVAIARNPDRQLLVRRCYQDMSRFLEGEYVEYNHVKTIG